MQHDARIGAPLRQDCQAAIGFRSRFGHYALCHLALEHQRQRLPERRPLRRRQPTHQKLGADVVRQIGGNADRRHQVLPGVDLQRIAVDHLELAGIARPDLGQRGQAARVLFDRQHLARPLGQQAPGQPAGAGADLEHVAARQLAGQPRDLGGKVEVEQEVLPQRLFCHQPVIGDHLAQRRQVVNRGHQASSLSKIRITTPAAPPRPPFQVPRSATPGWPGLGRRCRRRCRDRERCAGKAGRASH